MKKLILFFTIIGFLILIWFAINSSKVSLISPNTQISLITSKIPSAVEGPTLSLNYAKVTRVIDGDTIEIENGDIVRYIGGNTPEIETNECYATEASEINKNLVLGKTVKLEKDVSETDKYGRLLRYVYADGPERPKGVEWVFVDDELVKLGAAKIMTVPPDIKYKYQFLESQNYAKQNKLGLWGKCF